jgi:hypothetical protein
MLRYEINQQGNFPIFTTIHANNLLKVHHLPLPELAIFTAKQSTC